MKMVSKPKAPQVCLIHPAWFFLDASNDCLVVGSKKNEKLGIIFLKELSFGNLE